MNLRVNTINNELDTKIAELLEKENKLQKERDQVQREQRHLAKVIKNQRGSGEFLAQFANQVIIEWSSPDKENPSETKGSKPYVITNCENFLKIYTRKKEEHKKYVKS